MSIWTLMTAGMGAPCTTQTKTRTDTEAHGHNPHNPHVALVASRRN